MDLNADLGEGYGAWSMGDDEAMLEVVTSANVACGFHAGDPSSIRRTVDIAVERGVVIGAHVSYPDLRGFGRREMNLPLHQVTDDVLYQIGALDALARAAGSRVAYVKPHGALYNRCAADGELAGAVVAALRAYDPRLPLLMLPAGDGMVAAETGGVRAVPEGFADRAYTRHGHLVSRTKPGSVLADPRLVAERAVRMARDGVVEAEDGSAVALSVESLCVHGDSPGAVELAAAVRRALRDADVPLSSFVDPTVH